MHPNFPDNLSIGPAALPSGASNAYDAASQVQAIIEYGIAGRVWEATLPLSLYLTQPNNSDWEYQPPCSLFRHVGRKTVVELGSGSGYVAQKLVEALSCEDSAGCLTNTLFLTDLPDVCPLLQANMIQRAMPVGIDVQIRPLPWGDATAVQALLAELSQPPTHITLLSLTAIEESGTEVIIAYKMRDLVKESPFWFAFGTWFILEPVLIRERGGSSWQSFDLDEEGTFVFVARRRPTSFRRSIPLQPRLQGMGGDNEGADQFESLLLFRMSYN